MNGLKNSRERKSSRRRKYGKIVLLFLFLGLFLSPFFLNSFLSKNSVSTEINDQKNDILKTNVLSKEDYEPILTKKEQSLGEIILKDFDFNQPGFYNTTDLQEELGTILNITEDKINAQFISMEKPAKVDNQGKASENSKKLVVNLRDSLEANYDISIPSEVDQYFLDYRPKLGSIEIQDVYYSNVSSSPSLVKLSEENDDYNILTNDFVRFNYYDYFNNESREFKLYIDYTYDIPLINWTLTQKDISNLIYNNETTSLYPKFTYKFNLTTDIVPGDTYSAQRVPSNISLDLNITLPDKDLIYNHSLTVNGVGVSSNDFLTTDKVINITLTGDNTEFLLDFNTQINMKFEKPVGKTWAIDRLIEKNNIRERIYFPTITSGPKKIYCYVSILEDTISTDQVISTSSLFDREVSYTSVDRRDVEEEIGDSLVFTEQAAVKKGIKVKLPFIISNETVPFSIKYRATEDLRILVTDNVDMPAQNLKVKIFYFGQEYGSYISVEKTQPLADLSTNANGEILVKNVPNGFYQIQVYQGETILANTTVSSFQASNSVTTDIPHFPYIILVFGSVNAILLAAGAFIYIKNVNDDHN
ncbi:MAG: hypothetical protein BAJALOKI2v1_170010 [Promethearchaeota archaeon]|nr:MAG: hypothetical protein BAJALOKI2v1_170010 [Candidatus Lokiarchaeota archaeon]